MSSQDLLNVIGVTATVSLGLLSIGLAAFAIWLSRSFDKRSSAALEAIRDLARETRALVDVAVGQQREFPPRWSTPSCPVTHTAPRSCLWEPGNPRSKS